MGGLQRRDTYDEAVMVSMMPKLLQPPNRDAIIIINSPYAELMRVPFYPGYGITIRSTAKQDDDIDKGVRGIGEDIDSYAAMDAARHRARMRTMAVAVQTDAALGDGLNSGYNTGEEGELTRPSFLDDAAAKMVENIRKGLVTMAVGSPTEEIRVASEAGANAAASVMEKGGMAAAQLLRLLFDELSKTVRERTPGQMALATIIAGFAFLNEGGAFAPAAGVAQAAMAGATALSALGVTELPMKTIERLQGIDYDPARGSLLDASVVQLMKMLTRAAKSILKTRPTDEGAGELEQTVARAEELESSDRVRQLYQTFYRVGGFRSGGLRRLRIFTDAPTRCRTTSNRRTDGIH